MLIWPKRHRNSVSFQFAVPPLKTPPRTDQIGAQHPNREQHSPIEHHEASWVLMGCVLIGHRSYRALCSKTIPPRQGRAGPNFCPTARLMMIDCRCYKAPPAHCDGSIDQGHPKYQLQRCFRRQRGDGMELSLLLLTNHCHLTTSRHFRAQL